MGPKTQGRTRRWALDGTEVFPYTGVMRLAPALAVLAFLPAGARAASAPDWTDSGRPAFRAAQSLVDGAYAFAGRRLLAPLLPGSVARGLPRLPDGDAYAPFIADLRQREVTLAGEGAASVSAQRGALIGAFGQAMRDRYRLRVVGRAAQAWARDPAAWDPRDLAPAALLGGACAYLAGLRAALPAGPLDFRLDLAPGARLRAAASGTDRRLARVSVGRRGSPLSFYGEWSARSPERFGARLSRRF